MDQLPALRQLPEYPRLPSSLKVTQLIAELSRADLAASTIDMLKDRLQCVAHGLSIQVFTFEKGRTFYRARSIDTLPTGVGQVVHSTDPKLGRANRRGKPVLYTNLAAGSVFREIKACPGQTIALSCYRAIRPFYAVSAGFDTEQLLARGWQRAGIDWSKHPRSELAERVNRKMNSFLAQEFLKDVPLGQEHLYNISAAWSELILAPKEVSAVVYPSVANSGISDNVAFKVESIGEVLELIRVDFLRVNGMPGALNELTFLYKTDSIGSDGSLNFRPSAGFETHIHYDGDIESLSFQLDGSRWTLTTHDGTLVATEKVG